MAAEMRATLDGMYQAQAEAANRQKMADEVSRGIQDKHMSDMQRLLAAREASVPAANIDSSVHHTTNQYHSVMQEQTDQHMVLNYINANLQGIGAQMQKNGMTQEQMLKELMDRITKRDACQ